MLNLKINLLRRLSLLTGFAGTILISACSSGGATNQAPEYSALSIPTTTYLNKFALYTRVAGGPPTLTEIDTGSDFLLVESSYVGSYITMTTESITYVYDHGTNPRSGFIGYTSVAFLNGESGGTIIQTNNQVPVIVVADGVVGNGGNHAIMGLRMQSNVSVKLFLPYPYNQMFIFNAPKSQLTFGNFTPQQLSTFGTVNLPKSACNNSGVTTTASAPCWNDMAIPVKYTISGNPQGTTEYNTLFDSGAASSFQFSPLPAWLVLNNESRIENTIDANLPTTHGNLSIPLTNRVTAYDSNFNNGIVNAGNNLFNYYQVLFNQQNGTIGLTTQ